MTTEIYPGPATYTVTNAGPYAIGHEYTEDAITAAVIEDGAVLPLAPADWSVSPAAGAAGNLTLSLGAVTAHAGKTLIVGRATMIEQGWQGQGGAREAGLEAQLDRHAQALQEAQQLGRTALRVSDTEIGPIIPVDGAALVWSAAEGRFITGPDADEIANAEAYAETASAIRDYLDANYPVLALADMQALALDTGSLAPGTLLELRAGGAVLKAVASGGAVSNADGQQFVILTGPSFAARDGVTLAELARYPDGAVGYAAGLGYEADSSVLVAASVGKDVSVAGLKPYGAVTPEHCGEIGAGSDDGDALDMFWDYVLKGYPGKATGSYRWPARLNKTATANVSLDLRGATFTYTGASAVENMLEIECDGFSIFGTLGEWDGSNKAEMGLRVENDDATTPGPDAILSDGNFHDFKMLGPTGLNVAAGMFIIGNFDKAHVFNCRFKDISREASIPTASTQGLAITYESTRNARSIKVIGCTFDTITTEDTPDDARYTDMDGLSIFQLDQDGRECILTENTFIDCAGRAIKANAPFPYIHGNTIHRSVPGKNDGSIEIQCQKGAGNVHSNEITYTGAGTFENSITPVSFFTSQDFTTYGSKLVDGLAIRNEVQATTITAITKANPAQVTSTAHGLGTGRGVYISGVGGMVEIEDGSYIVTVVDDDNFTLDNVDSTGFTSYTSGGTVQSEPDALVDISYASSLNANDRAHRADIRAVSMDRGSATYLLNVDNFGQTGNAELAHLNVDGIRADCSRGMASTATTLPNCRAAVANVRSNLPDVPAVWDRDATSLASNISEFAGIWGRWKDIGGNLGILAHYGSLDAQPGLLPQVWEYVGDFSGARGSGVIFDGTFTGDETKEFLFGAPAAQGKLKIAMMFSGEYYQAEWSIQGTTLVPVFNRASATLKIGAGADPGSGSFLRTWISAGVLYVRVVDANTYNVIIEAGG